METDVNAKIAAQAYVAVDLETTGLDPKRDRIIEIGAVRVENGRETAQFHTMINPHRELAERITELTGISGDMVEDAPDIGDILSQFLDFCGKLPLLGHHVIFDYSFLKRAAVNLGMEFEREGIDTCLLYTSTTIGPFTAIAPGEDWAMATRSIISSSSIQWSSSTNLFFSRVTIT